MRLQGALDNEICAFVEKLHQSDGVVLDANALYNALQRSNSSLKRRPKKSIIASIERVVEFLGLEENASQDSEAELEAKVSKETSDLDVMNRSLRANLAGPQEASASPQVTTAGNKRAPNGESLPKRVKRSNEEKISTAPPTELSLSDLGGMHDIIAQLKDLVVAPIQMADEYAALNLPIPKGVLLHGPPGCGKTMISRAIAATMKLPFIEILGPAVVSSMSGDSEKAIRERFEEAKKQAPCLIFIDEIDAIAPKRDTSQSQMEKRLVAQLLVSMDDLNKGIDKPVMVLAATNRPDSLDPALRRGGRFGSEINIGVPNEQVRQQILRAQTRSTPLADDVDFAQLAKATAGFVGADLHDMVSKAGTHLLKTYGDALEQQAEALGLIDQEEMRLISDDAELGVRRLIARTNRADILRPPGFDKTCIRMSDFLAVLPAITPSSKREGFATIPDISWKDVGALQDVREALRAAIVYPIQNPEIFIAAGLTAPSGVLLWGPPGCGKTLLAQAAAAESKANFISVKGPELLNKFVGESEAAVRKVFMRARSSVPCVIFFDELDALVPKRNGDVGGDASARVVNTLLTELDGMNDRDGIYVVAATNRPDAIDPAMLRPGRFGEHLFVDVPGAVEREDIFRTLARKYPCDVTEEILSLVRSRKCQGYSGADLGALLRKAAMNMIKVLRTRMEMQDVELAAADIRPSIQDPEMYREMAKWIG